MSDDPVPKRPPGPSVLVSNRQDLPVDAPALRTLAEEVLRGEGRTNEELSLSFVAEVEMAELHERFMGEPGPTDVLSFPMGKGGEAEDGLLGDVVVCPAVALRNGPDLNGELRLLVAHGVLHLLGFDHEEDDERAEMWARQERYSGVRIP